jgi:enoyl-CoA hydratase
MDVSEFVSIHTDAHRPGVATVVLSRPPTNALTRQVYREVAAAATGLAERADVAAVVLFGGHEIFSAGDDMSALRGLNKDEIPSWVDVRRAAVEAVATIPKPTVAAITGYALGAGLTLALSADWRVSGDNAKFGATEVLAGLIPDDAGLAGLTRAVGAGRAKELVYSGRFFDAREALALGVVDDMVAPDHVYEAAVAWASRFVDAPAYALAAAKAGVDDVFAKTPAERVAAARRRYVEVFAANAEQFADRNGQ